MSKVFAWDNLLKQSENWDISYDGFALTIDNFYEQPDAIYEYLMKKDFPLWKYSTERNSKNSIEYNDCRVVDTIGHPTRLYFNDMDRILNVCRKHWWKFNYNWSQNFEVNCFQTINQFDTTLQHYPHIDSAFNTPDHLSTLNMLVYLDKEEDGGTAIYEGTWITNNEQESLLYPVEDDFKIEQVIEHKFNRCVIFPGNRLHGAYINDYNKYKDDKWRFTQVIFFHPQQNART
jgi:hypothetical protein